jgi:hypothetical protein
MGGNSYFCEGGGRGHWDGKYLRPEPVFVNLLRSPGIDSSESIPRNRFLGSFVYKYELSERIRRPVPELVNLSWSPGIGSRPGRPRYYNPFWHTCLREPEFVNFLRSPLIDFQPGGPLWQSYLTTGPPAYIGWRNRFLRIGLFKRLQIFGLWFLKSW